MNLKKEMNVNVYIAASSALGLLAAGGLGGWLCARAYLSRGFYQRMDDEMEAVRLHYLNKAAKESDPAELLAVAGDDAATAYHPVDEDGDHGGRDEGRDRDREGEGPQPSGPRNTFDDYEAGPASGEHAVAEDADVGESEEDDRDHSQPYPISQAEFANTEPGWEAISLKFYSGDPQGVLTDDEDNPILHYEKLVGTLSPDLFGGISGQGSIRLVRNDERECDFEILHVEASYADAVLNYGRPK